MKKEGEREWKSDFMRCGCEYKQKQRNFVHWYNENLRTAEHSIEKISHHTLQTKSLKLSVRMPDEQQPKWLLEIGAEKKGNKKYDTRNKCWSRFSSSPDSNVATRNQVMLSDSDFLECKIHWQEYYVCQNAIYVIRCVCFGVIYPDCEENFSKPGSHETPEKLLCVGLSIFNMLHRELIQNEFLWWWLCVRAEDANACFV